LDEGNGDDDGTGSAPGDYNDYLFMDTGTGAATPDGMNGDAVPTGHASGEASLEADLVSPQ
jgi:hypothetical protein